jgi:hypothetical protein
MSEHAFSADVELMLRLPGQDVRLSQVGPSDCIVQGNYGQIVPQLATLVVRVDDHVNETRVRLLNPIENDGCRVGFERLLTEQEQRFTPSQN